VVHQPHHGRPPADRLNELLLSPAVKRRAGVELKRQAADISTCGYDHSVGLAYACRVDEICVIRPQAQAAAERQQLEYFLGVSGDTCGSTGLAMHLVVVPPGAAAEPHYHDGYETAIYQLEGRVQTRYGEGLARSVVTEAGDFLFVPPGVPHQPVNLSTSERAVALIARNDASEQERVVPYRA
jgi:uncharacterized RmlC-like cupin family protein